MRVLVVSSRPAGGRRPALAPLFGPGDRVTWLPAGATLPALDTFDALVVDGHPAPRPTAELAALARRVEEGASLVAIGAAPHERDEFWTGLLGVMASDPFPVAEWFAKIAPWPSTLTARIDDEFPVIDGIEPLVTEDTSGLRDGGEGAGPQESAEADFTGNVPMPRSTSCRLTTAPRWSSWPPLRACTPRWRCRCCGPASTSSSRNPCA